MGRASGLPHLTLSCARRLGSKVIGYIKGIFHARMNTVKDWKIKDLADTDEINKRWQEHTEKLYKKGINDPDNHNYVVTHPEPDILECEVRKH